MAKKLKFKVESSATPRPKPQVPGPGKGPKIEIPKPTGPKIEVPKNLQQEVLKYNPKAPSGVRGAPAGQLEHLRPKLLPAPKPTIQLPEEAASRRPVPAKSMTVDVKPTSSAKYVSRAEVAEMGVKETVRPSAKLPPKPLQLPAGQMKQATQEAVVQIEQKVVQPAKETTKKVMSKLGELPKKVGKALVQEANPYRQALGLEKKGSSIISKIKGLGSGIAKTAKYGRLVARAGARLALPVAIAEGAYTGGKMLYEVGQERAKAESALAGTDILASRIAKKTGAKITRPELTFLDKAGMTFIPGYDAPASDPNQMKVYDSSGKQISGPRKKRR